MFNLVMFGPPGCGKGTQSQKVVGKYALQHLSTGNIFRKEIKNNTAIGQLAKKFTDKGYLIPDDIVLREILRNALQYRHLKGLVFDGFPRTLNQAVLLDRMLHKRKLDINIVISIEANEEELIERIHTRSLVSTRKDDVDDEVILNRIKVYNEQTKPVINYFNRQGKFFAVNGMAPIVDVFSEICCIIDNYID